MNPIADSSPPRRIVCLLPSLTELVFALGRGDQVVGVTHECDFPPEAVARGLPCLTRSVIPPGLPSAEIDRLVAERGGSLYDLDLALLDALEPDLILTQSQCDVCAVNERTVRATAADLRSRPRVETVNPTDLAGVQAMVIQVGEWIDARDHAQAWVDQFHATAATIAARRAGRPAARTIHLEWLDPPFVSGHWNPELIALAGGVELLGRAGAESRRCDWKAIAQADPDAILVACCGFDVTRAEVDLADLAQRSGSPWRSLRAVQAGNVTVVDGSAFFSRPGPRLEESLRIAAAALDDERCRDLAPPEGRLWRRWPAQG